MIPGKFAITLHILTLLTKSPDEFLSSEYIAGSMNINPVLVRKEIGNLKKHNVVESREGKFGGTRLAKPATEITLEDIYDMTFDCMSLGYSKNDPNPNCPVGKKINENLDSLYKSINTQVRGQLKGISLLQFTRDF
jgi:DNA-binding IscR family transcriptional regulator